MFLSTFFFACAPEPTTPPKPLVAETPQTAPWFREVAAEVGIDFIHQDGRSGRRHYVETAASGGGFFDFDDDGDLDVYLVNGALTPGSPPGPAPRNALYEQRDGRFVEIGAAAGVDDSGYGMGMCVGDVDGDGRLDLFVTNYGRDRLYLGRGADAATWFEDISERAGFLKEKWSTGCAFADLDGDEDLDLYVAVYLDYEYDRGPTCGDEARGIASYCRPAVYDGVADLLYLNQGDGTFRESGEERGIVLDGGRRDKGYGVLIRDFDDDGDADVAVANDGTPNRLWINDGRGFFVDHGLASGFAVNVRGAAEAGMGIDAEDLDGDGRFDLIVANYAYESHTLYRSASEPGETPFFEDRTAEFDLQSPTFLPVGWGVRAFDADLDGDLDLAVASGHVIDNIELFDPTLDYAQPDQFFERVDTENGPRWREVAGAFPGTAAGVAPAVGRGLATGDFDDDGRLDVLVVNTGEPPHLWQNVRAGASANWVSLKLRGRAPNTAAIGARVELFCGGESAGVREVRSGGSFLSQSDLRLHFGLGECAGPSEAVVLWPGGETGRIVLPELRRSYLLTFPDLLKS